MGMDPRPCEISSIFAGAGARMGTNDGRRFRTMSFARYVSPFGGVVLASVGAMLVGSASAAGAHELALATGTITIREAPSGLRSPTCGELVVEARDALDNRLFGQTHAEIDAEALCRYAISVPAQTAVWVRLRPALVDAARSTAAAGDPDGASSGAPSRPATSGDRGGRRASASVALRFRVVGGTTYVFVPGEQKIVPLTY
ncbi:MAG: hypothetical protein NVS3B7_07080 [Candidatus Elarobacter sp.]